MGSTGTHTYIYSFTNSFSIYVVTEFLAELPVQVRCTILDAWGWCTGTTQRDGMGREEGGGFTDRRHHTACRRQRLCRRRYRTRHSVAEDIPRRDAVLHTDRHRDAVFDFLPATGAVVAASHAETGVIDGKTLTKDKGRANYIIVLFSGERNT